MTLKNFAAVKNAMDANEICIDFSTAQNKICLLIGPNGSGKTTLLSMLHPFADLGNLDVRNGNKLILDGKEGYKEIIIKKNKEVYTIKHFYTPHKDKSHSVKSYIELNGNELNPNGNVTSFKEMVKDELQIEPEYLKLIRLGNNVTSFIDLSSTERKNFMGKIMDDIGIFLEYYKSINNKLKQLDEMISHTIDKLNRLQIEDTKIATKEIEKLEKELAKLEASYVEENSKLAIFKKNISEIDDSENLRDNLMSVSKKFHKMESILEKKDSIESMDVSFYDTKIREMEMEIAIKENEKKSNLIFIENSLKLLDSTQDQLRSSLVQLRKEEESDKEIGRMNDNLTQIRLKLREYENNLGDYSATYSKKDLEDFIVYLKNTQLVLSRTYEFGKQPVAKVVELMRKNKNVMNYINKHLIDIDEKNENDTSSVFLTTLMSRFMLKPGSEMVFACKEECQAKTLYQQISNILSNSEVSDKNNTASFYHDMEFVYQNLMSVLPRFAEYKLIIDQFPEDIKKEFLLEQIYDKIGKLEIIYDDGLMNSLLSYATEYDNYLSLMREYQMEEETMKKFSGLSNFGYIKEQIESLESSIEETRQKISDYKERNILLTEDIDECEKTLEVYRDIKETLEKHDEIKALYERYSKEYEILKENRDNIYLSEVEISRLKILINNSKTEIQDRKSKLDMYEEYNKELSNMSTKYDDLQFLKRAYSSKEGIPLYYMKICLGNTISITNTLLDIAYNGRIALDEFNITASEFSIPFYNKGVLLPDVKYASQGELSFLSIALSFALASQVLSKYNIMLLDEIDGVLDTSNREKFIAILENQIDRIHSEQNFLITHNAMFSSYPVDIIDLSFHPDKELYPLANYIEIERIS